MDDTRHCDECGDEYSPHTTWQRFCSPGCRDRAWGKLKAEAAKWAAANPKEWERIKTGKRRGGGYV